MAGAFLRVLKNLNNPNHVRLAGGGAFILQSFDWANIYSTLQYFPPPKPCITRQSAYNSCARRSLADASVSGC